MPNRTICIIDDEPDVAETIKGLIETGLSYRCKTFNDLESCFEQLESSEVDLIISDIMMPTGSGLRLRNLLDERNLSVPIIYVSGHADVIAEENIILLRKPIQQDRLFCEIRSILTDR